MDFVKVNIGNDWNDLVDLTQYTNITFGYKMIKRGAS